MRRTCMSALLTTAALALLALLVPTASAVRPSAGSDKAQRLAAKAANREVQRQALRWPSFHMGITDGLAGPVDTMQHGAQEGHLPPTRRNVRLVSKLSPTSPFGNIVPEQIADLSVHERFVYLNSWADPTCTRGGTYVVDITRPDRPREAGFLPALPGNYHGEGADTIELRTNSFRGDVLAVNNERCAAVEVGGGFDLYDVSNPRRPQVLVRGFGDTGPDDGSLVGDEIVHDSHNLFMWQDGRRAYIVIVDNFELHDVDIFEITDPRNPRPVAEFDLVESFPQIVDNSAFGNLILNHDDVVKEIDGTQTMVLSYWDAGYVTLDVDDPANPQYIGDTSFDGPDPLTGFEPPEGNAHQAEFSADDRFLLAADEDFSPFRARVNVAGGGAFNAAEATDTRKRIDSLPDGSLGPGTTFVGRACPATGGDTVPPAPADDGDPNTDDIAVIVRGLCSFEEKVNAVKAAGWDGWMIYNNAGRPDGDPLVTNGIVVSGGDLPGVFTRRQDVLPGIFGITNDTDPAVGTRGQNVSVNAEFDGWGYTHLYRNEAGKMTRLDSYAVPEALDERFATGFGDLSVHEFATDPEARLAYSSYYAAGFRVLRFGGARGLRETGRFIDEGGNNFWGVEQFTARGDRLQALSDRDFGLYIFEYTGPGSQSRDGDDDDDDDDRDDRDDDDRGDRDDDDDDEDRND
jgi:hypothetical protein